MDATSHQSTRHFAFLFFLTTNGEIVGEVVAHDFVALFDILFYCTALGLFLVIWIVIHKAK